MEWKQTMGYNDMNDDMNDGTRRFGMRSFGGPRRSFAPVKEGEEIDVTVEAIAAKGDGIAKKQGFVIFVPGTKVGDVCKIRITKVLQKVAFSEIISRGGTAKAAPASDEEPSDESSDDSSDEESDKSDESPAEDTEDFGDDEEKN